MSSSSPRITARIDSDTQALLGRAAQLSGIPTINAFVLGAAVEKAKAILKEEHMLMLNGEQSLQLLNALDNPPEPNEALKRLFARHGNDKA